MPHWRDSSGNVYYYFADAIGSIRAVTNSSGTTCFEADYYPYGQENDYNTSCSPTYKFTGYEFDSETGNYYAYARYYDPRLGRFLSADPLGGSVGNPQSLNRYAYVLNNPEAFVDPSGMQWVPAGAGSGLRAGCMENNETDQVRCPPPVPGPELVGDCSGQWGLICQMFADEVASLVGYQPGPFAGTATTGPKSVPKPPCPAVPPHPTNASVDANVAAAQAFTVAQGTALGEPAAHFVDLGYLYDQFRTGGPQDYKQEDERYAEFGNFNYGAVCAGMGFNLTFCQSAAGAGLLGRVGYQNALYYMHIPGVLHRRYNGAGTPFLKAPYGDQPADSAEIAAGYYYEGHCMP